MPSLVAIVNPIVAGELQSSMRRRGAVVAKGGRPHTAADYSPSPREALDLTFAEKRARGNIAIGQHAVATIRLMSTGRVRTPSTWKPAFSKSFSYSERSRSRPPVTASICSSHNAPSSPALEGTPASGRKRSSTSRVAPTRQASRQLARIRAQSSSLQSCSTREST